MVMRFVLASGFQFPVMPALPVDNWWFLGFVLFVLIVCIWLVARLVPTTTDDIDTAEIHRQMLSTVRELHSQGELTPEEYRSIKGHLVERLALQPACTDPEVYAQNDQQVTENNTVIYSATETDPGSNSSDAEPNQSQIDTTLTPHQNTAFQTDPERHESDR